MDEYDLTASQIKSFNNDSYIFKIKNKLLSEKYLIIICGPTAIGKSKIALILAMILKTDLISADSMQSYTGMNIGTDKQDFSKYGVKQFLINICKPDYFLTSAEYRNNAREVIKCEFFNKNKIPILVGGSGLHIRAIVDDLLEAPEGDSDLRKKIKTEINNHDLDYLYEKLKNIDPSYASKISPNDERRVIRALEVYEKTGKKFSEFQNKWKDRKSIYKSIFIGLNNNDRKKLYENIDNRINEMIKNGLVEEVKNLVELGYKNSFSMQQAIGYKELIKYFDGKYTLENAIDEIKKNSKHLAKKQLTWFKADNRINWITVSNYDNIYNLINEILKIIYSRIFYEEN